MFDEFVLLSIPAVLLACATLPPGQERIITIRGEGLTTIPLECAYSNDATVQQNNPSISKTSNDAVKNLRKYVKKAVTAVVKEEAKKAGLESLVSDIGKQIKPTPYYTPIDCSRAGTPARPQAPANTGGFSCVVEDEIITKVAYSQQNTATIPVYFQQFTIVLSISNSVIGGWSREMWDTVLLKAQSKLASGTFGRSFRTVTLMQL
ncbi:hypothetical protein RB195_025577 [Necator americanus]|uniref:Uncharacterized protein n=2 Tax=Necator americanus TaxID=51031 RepID=A0ABR1ET03_NECAM|nr:hypothetical protein NECAME_05795 [Necator americanus]ETN86949.1 hypothetical protein NECAME_05795 [Necator americanus]